MKKITFGFALLLLLAGSSCTTQTSTTTNTTNSNTSNANSNVVTTKIIDIGGVATAEIPLTCAAEGAAGSTYITCPTATNATPDPIVVISTDGNQVNVRHGQTTDDAIWNEITTSVKATPSASHTVQITIEQ